jgi:hypothetical protein
LETDDGKRSNYFKKAGMIHYRQYDNVFSLVYSRVSGAHYKTFRALSVNFAKDKRHIYYRDAMQPQVDYETFEITDEETIQDKNFKYRINSDQTGLIPIIENERYKNLQALIEDNRYNKNKIKTGDPYDYDDKWIRLVEKRISFKLPDSYIWLMSRYGFIEVGLDRVKVITYPDFRPDSKTSILNQTNRKSRGLSSDNLIIMENDEETYYFLFEKDLAGNEYKVYRMNNRTRVTELFANDLLKFIELQINQHDCFGNKIGNTETLEKINIK